MALRVKECQVLGYKIREIFIKKINISEFLKLIILILHEKKLKKTGVRVIAFNFWVFGFLNSLFFSDNC